MRSRMHDDETLTDAALGRRLLAEQQPQWAGLPLVLVEHFGTDHDVYRLGDALSLRLPRTAWAAAQASKEAELLPRLAPHLPVALPEVLALGSPTSYYPHAWSVQSWLPGADLLHAEITPEQLADDLGDFVRSLRSLPTDGAPLRPATSRGGDLATHDAVVAQRIAELGERVDGEALARAWVASSAAVGPAEECWTHGDLLPGNLLAEGGRLTGAIDFGALNVTDPALDLTPCWYLFDGVGSPAARRYLEALGADPDDVLRARGWAQLQALNALPYYWDTNPGMVRLASAALRLIERG